MARCLRHLAGLRGGVRRLERPNGIAVVDDLAFVVERDNHRVQVFSLPDLAPLGVFGASVLRLPYGLAVERAREEGEYRVYVTDNYEMPDGTVPPDSLLGERVRVFDVMTDSGGRRVASAPVRAFGETEGAGVLRVVESIAVDPASDRLLLAEEREGESRIKVYTRDGRYTGRNIDSGFFPHQAEGIQLYACGDTAGYWITTDQDLAVNTFHVFDRGSLRHLGSFRGDVTRNTDAIALTQRSFGGFEQGAFYAVHDDGGIAAFSWAAVADALGLRNDCTVRASGGG